MASWGTISKIGAKAPEINTTGTLEESKCQWERNVAGTLARRRESTDKREEQHKPQDEDRACRLQQDREHH